MNETRHSKKTIFLAYLEILRMLNGIIAGFAATFAILLANPKEATLDWVTIIFVVLSATFVSSQAMIFNDIADRKEDKINAPHRAIPSGKIETKHAVIYAIVVAVLGVLFAALIDIRNGFPGISVITALFFGGTLDLYNFKLKKRGFVGNLMIGLNVVAVFAYGSIHSYLLTPNSFPWLPTIVGIAAGAGNVGREVIKGLPDIPGDKAAGNKTIAVKYGKKKAALIAAGFLSVLVVLAVVSIIIADLYVISTILVSLVAIMVTILTIGIVINPSPEWAYKTKEILLLLFLGYLLIFIVDTTLKILL